MGHGAIQCCTTGVPTPFYSFPVHSLSIPSHSSPLLLLPLTTLIPTIFVTFLEVSQPSRDDPTRVPVFLTSLFLCSYLPILLLSSCSLLLSSTLHLDLPILSIVLLNFPMFCLFLLTRHLRSLDSFILDLRLDHVLIDRPARRRLSPLSSYFNHP